MESFLIFLCPYKEAILKGMGNVQGMELFKIIVVGDRKRIIELCYLYKVSYDDIEIIDAQNYIDMCFIVNGLVKKRNILGITIGDFPKAYYKNIGNIEYEINVVDAPYSAHLLFVVCSLKGKYIGFEEKEEAIKIGKSFMRHLHIEYLNIGLVSGDINKIVKIEKNVIKMDSELKYDNIEVIGIKDIFASKYNLLIFNNLDSTRIFLDTILMNNNSKYANLKKASNIYIIDAEKMNTKDVVFSIFLLNKITFYAKVS